MPRCPKCRKDYSDAEPACPRCGAPHDPASLSPVPGRRCGAFSYLCLRFAQVATFFAIILCIVAGVLALIRNYWFEGLVTLFIGTPIAIGQWVAFRLAVSYANQRD